MIDRQLPGEAAMSNQSRPRALLLNPPASPSSSPPSPPAKPQRGILTRVRGSPNNDRPHPRVFWSTTPVGVLSCGGSSLALGIVKLEGRKTSRDWQMTPRTGGLGSLPNPTYMPAPTVAPARSLGAPSAESQALSVFPPHPHLTSPRLLALPLSPWPSLANQSRLCPSQKLWGASRSPLCLIDVPYAVVPVMRAPTELRALPHI